MKTFGYVKVASIGATAADVGLKEKSDCTVRALANAKGIDYLTAHATAKQHGRVSGKGVHFNVLHSMYTAMGFELLNIFGTTRPAWWARMFTGTKTIEKGITLKRLLPKLNKGRYIVNITGHALAVVDGKVIDTNHNRESVSVIAVFKLKEEN